MDRPPRSHRCHSREDRGRPRDQTEGMDLDRAGEIALRAWKYREGELVATMIHLGDRLGLYRAMRGAGALTVEDLAELTGLHPRWLREWLLGQAAAGLIDSEDGTTFELTEEQAAVLADDETSLFFAAGAFAGPLDRSVVDGLADAFVTGRGLPYDALGSTGAHATERMLGPWTRLMLIPGVIGAVEGLTERLREGARVVDIGCGGGLAVATLAREFPASRFIGVDPSRHALELAASKTVDLRNVELRCTTGDDLGEEPFDLALTFDCLHDMAHPDRTVAELGRVLADDGIWLVKEIRTSGDFRTDRKNPVLAMMYAMSVTTCMSSALSEPDGWGLGTLGLPETALRELASTAGFTRLTVHDIGDPANLYYEIRR